MQALIKMLKNTSANTFHPIMYLEDHNSTEELIKYKSKGHRTTGFTDREEAIKSIDTELVERLKTEHTVNIELNDNIEWDGREMPTDIQFRNRIKE